MALTLEHGFYLLTFYAFHVLRRFHVFSVTPFPYFATTLFGTCYPSPTRLDTAIPRRYWYSTPLLIFLAELLIPGRVINSWAECNTHPPMYTLPVYTRGHPGLHVYTPVAPRCQCVSAHFPLRAAVNDAPRE